MERWRLFCGPMKLAIRSLKLRPSMSSCLSSDAENLTMTNSAIVLVSGENNELALLHILYGQRTEARERKAFKDIADFYGVKDRLDVSIEYLAKIGGSSLTDASMDVTEADLGSKEIPTSYVPFRNAN